MRRCGVNTGRGHRHNRGVIAPVPIGPQDGGVIDVSDQFVFAHAYLGFVTDHGVHTFHNAGSAAHICNFGRRFYRPLPVNEACRVAELNRFQVFLQR